MIIEIAGRDSRIRNREKNQMKRNGMSLGMFLGLGAVLCFAILSAGGSAAAIAQNAADTPAAELAVEARPAVEARAVAERPVAELPIRRVALFAGGVGYFERSGMVAGGSDVQMMFRVEDINDILKSMVITGAEN